VIDLDALAQAAACLDPLPASVVRLAGVVASGDPDLGEIAEIVSFDQALTAGLLRAANSSWSAARTPVTTVRDAIVRLGSAAVLSMALDVNVKARMNRAVPEYGLAEGDLWRHSVAASLAGELLQRRARAEVPPEAVAASLLHDVGKLLMARFLDADLLLALQRAHDEGGLSRMAAEAEVLGVHHGELGALVAQDWDLPEGIVVGIAYHHDPDSCDATVAYTVHLADCVAKVVTPNVPDHDDVEAFAHSMEHLALSADDYDAVCMAVADRFADVTRRFE
jgi:HD-like signal output (HDOD) protein